MKISRRGLFRNIGLGLGLIGAGRWLTPAHAHAGQTSPIGQGQVGVEWLGHGSFLFTSCTGKRILFDPWIHTNPKCPGQYRAPRGFETVDLILWTHGHVDHFMLDDAKMLVTDYQPKIVAPWELNFFIKSEIPSADCGTFTLGNKGCSADFMGVKITMVEASHSAGAQLTGFEGTNRFVGEAVGYLLEFENGLKLYHSGDTALMGDMRTIIGEFYRPDVAILPIGGVFTMGPAEAAYACKLIGPKIVIPEHYGTFPVLEPDAARFKAAVQETAPEVSVMEVKPGAPIQL